MPNLTELAARCEAADASEQRELLEAAVTYLVALADWAAGEGFCQIPGIEDPDEWCFRMWDELRPDSNGDDYSAANLAAALLASKENDNG